MTKKEARKLKPGDEIAHHGCNGWEPKRTYTVIDVQKHSRYPLQDSLRIIVEDKGSYYGYAVVESKYYHKIVE